MGLRSAPTLPSALLDEMLSATTLPVERVAHGRLAALARCHLALCASGTATLEVGLVGTPMIVLSDGTSLGGYLSPDKLLAALEEHEP